MNFTCIVKIYSADKSRNMLLLIILELRLLFSIIFRNSSLAYAVSCASTLQFEFIKNVKFQSWAYMGVGGSGGFRPPPPESEIPYPDPSQTRCLGKILTKNVFFRPFWAIFRPASGIFRKVALPRFFELPTFDRECPQLHCKILPCLIPTW